LIFKLIVVFLNGLICSYSYIANLALYFQTCSKS